MNRYLLLGIFAIAALLGISVYQYFHFYDGRLHIVYCSVGQGDAVLITTPNHKHILIDSGPGDGVVGCLTNHLAFWDRTIDLAFLTHPHADHYTGYYYLIDKFSVNNFITEDLHISKQSAAIQELEKKLSQKNVRRHTVTKGDLWRIGENIKLTIEAPDLKWLEQHANYNQKTTSENTSLIVELSYGTALHLLFTGDAQIDEISHVLKDFPTRINILQVPHHGSKTGTSPEILDALKPDLAVISVGKKNIYNLPNPSVVEMITDKKIMVKRTDQDGDVEIVSDGKMWRVDSD